PFCSLAHHCLPGSRSPLDLHSFPTRRSSDLGIFRGRRKGHAVKNLAGALPAEAVRCTLIGRLGSQNGNSELDVQAKRPHYRGVLDRKSTRLNSSHGSISYAVFCLKKKRKNTI